MASELREYDVLLRYILAFSSQDVQLVAVVVVVVTATITSYGNYHYYYCILISDMRV